jgi:protein CpxP
MKPSLSPCTPEATTRKPHVLLRFAAVGLLGCATIAPGSQVAAAETPAQILVAQAQPAASPQNVEGNIATLHQRLQITPAQEAQFNAVANVMRENARAEAGAPQQPPAGATAIDDLRAYIRYSEVELAGLKKMLPALEALYATLSPTQKRAADATFRQEPGG